MKQLICSGVERGETQHPVHSVRARDYGVLEDCGSGSAGHLQVPPQPTGPHAAHPPAGLRCRNTA